MRNDYAYQLVPRSRLTTSTIKRRILAIHGIHDHSVAIGCTSRIMRYKSKALGNPGRSER
jgi:hypothetical protein